MIFYINSVFFLFLISIITAALFILIAARGIRYWTYVSSLLFLPICATCVCVCLLSFLIIPNYLNVDAQLAARVKLESFEALVFQMNLNF
jgi:phosphoglycerol transferase MdoB-like AlkP superfamily enzyme